MKNPTFVAEAAEETSELHRAKRLKGLRLLKAFLKLEPGQRFEIIELVERPLDRPCTGAWRQRTPHYPDERPPRVSVADRNRRRGGTPFAIA